MATRQEIQIANDLVRFVNIVNDLIDVAAYAMQEIDAQTGEPLRVEELIDSRSGLPFLPATQEERDEFGIANNRFYTFDELKENILRTCQNVQGYKTMILNFLDTVDQAMVVSGLSALGVDVLMFKNELLAMNVVRDYVAMNLPLTATKSDLAVLGQYVDANVPKLTLIRRSWCLGI